MYIYTSPPLDESTHPPRSLDLLSPPPSGVRVTGTRVIGGSGVTSWYQPSHELQTKHCPETSVVVPREAKITTVCSDNNLFLYTSVF